MSFECLRHAFSTGSQRFANLDDIRDSQEPRASKLYFTQTDNEGFADKTATMPIPFETLLPYGIIIAMFGVTGAGLNKIKNMQSGGKRHRWSVDQWDK
ncbi:hypothetical protein C8A00DRAFT_28637 [Chaetomidium leptoderma]|uniref:NADH dehydrogenase [ubiquinone] 1 alpha subcomplex subunit 1 n=1 Tax=Chaetomidium leptoderma TaxID=669021 RepID=A0AAN6VYA3_9PEZI|nr:hypothetical protein C8A00DRAFT_28637 [Chaetomidium leptoderma]